MSSISKTTGSLSRNDKVIQYLHCSTNNSFKISRKIPTNNLFPIQQHRLQSSSEYDSLSSSSSSVNDSPSQSDGSIASSLSDPIAYSSMPNSNISSDEDLDFNLGFEQISDDDEDGQYIFNKNNADAVTLLGESIVDEYLRQSSNSTVLNDEYDVTNDDTITEYYTKQQRRASFLHDSTYTLCSQDRFSAYIDGDQETEQTIGFPIRSNSFSALPIDSQSTFIEKAPKKAVHFADMMGLDLESIRYMTPPDPTATSIIQEYVRFQLGQLRLTRNQLDLPIIKKRTSSVSLLPSPTKQYNLVSKNFTSPINITPIIYEKQVLLECLYTKDSTAYGTIRVHNCAYDKRVFIRLSQDEWRTTNDIQSSHSMNYSHDNTDTFAFQITLSKSIDEMQEPPKRILFAVCFQAMYQDFWDNNQGWNYVLDVFERR